MKAERIKVIEFTDVNFTYDSHLEPTLRNVNLSIYQGESIMILGPNGSGKSTFGNLAAGLLKNYTGTIKLFNESILSQNHSSLVQKVGTVFQNPESQFIGNNVEKDLVFGMENLRYSPNLMRDKLYEIVKKMNLESIFFAQPSELSGGKKQKVAFAASTITSPEIMIFDEPTSLLSPTEQLEIWGLIDELNKKKNLTVLEITHDVNRALKADRVLIIADNKVHFFDTPKQLLDLNLAPVISALGSNLPLLYQLVIQLLEQKILTKPIWNQTNLIKTLAAWKK